MNHIACAALLLLASACGADKDDAVNQVCTLIANLQSHSEMAFSQARISANTIATLEKDEKGYVKPVPASHDAKALSVQNEGGAQDELAGSGDNKLGRARSIGVAVLREGAKQQCWAALELRHAVLSVGNLVRGEGSPLSLNSAHQKAFQAAWDALSQFEIMGLGLCSNAGERGPEMSETELAEIRKEVTRYESLNAALLTACHAAAGQK